MIAGILDGSRLATLGGTDSLQMVVLQADGLSVIGPTAVLVGAVVLAAVARVAERFVDPISLGSNEPTDRTYTPSSTPSTETGSTGSTAGRTIETSSSKPDPTEATENVDTGSSVGTPNATAGSRSERTQPEHATGTFKTRPGGGTLMVTSVGFEPDLVFLTGASKGPTSKTGFAEGWSHGIARRTGLGDVEQFAVSIADTGTGTAGGGIREDASLDLPVSTGDGDTDAVWGKITTTVDEGFQFEVSSPSGHDSRATVQYHAVDLPDGADASVGTFGLGSEPREGKVDLGVDADFVSLTATTGARPLTRSPDRPVSISHGTAVQPAETPFQSAVGSSVNMVGGSYAAHNDRAIHLLHPGDDDVDGRTSMRVTSLGSTMRLRLEEIYEEAPVCFAVYAAVSMPDGVESPSTGLVRAPGPKRGARRDVETDYQPGVVSMSASAGAVDDREQSLPGGLEMLGWSHGVVGGDPGGVAGQMPLRTVGEDGLVDRGAIGVAIEEEGFVMASMEDVDGDPPLVLYTTWPGDLEE